MLKDDTDEDPGEGPLNFALVTPLSWIVELISLAEDLMAVYLFDDDRFPVVLVFLVRCPAKN